MTNYYDERVRPLIAKPRAFRVVAFPGAEFKVAVRLLSDAEIDFCREEAQKQFRKVCDRNKWSPVEAMDLDPTMLSRLVEREMISRAFFDADTIATPSPAPFFPSATDVGDVGSSVTTQLMKVYLEHQDVVNPSVEVVDEEELRGIVEALGKEPDVAVSLMGFEPNTLRRLVRILVRLLAS